MKKTRASPYEFDGRFAERLIKDGFVIEVGNPSLSSTFSSANYKLGPEGIRVFEGDDLFNEFYELFPNSVDSGFGRRVISAKDPNSISGKTTHDIWRRVTKDKPFIQRKIIDCLKRELESRKANNSLGFIQGIDTWLRQATWEKWEDIPNEKKSTGYTKL